MSGTAPSVDLSMTNSLLTSGSPKGVYTFFLLACAKNYFEVMREKDSGAINIEGATIALIAFCPNRAERERIWKFYEDYERTSKSAQNASAKAIGELISYLSEVLEFEEQANAGLL
jgi:hypothetical protein